MILTVTIEAPHGMSYFSLVHPSISGICPIFAVAKSNLDWASTTAFWEPRHDNVTSVATTGDNGRKILSVNSYNISTKKTSYATMFQVSLIEINALFLS